MTPVGWTLVQVCLNSLAVAHAQWRTTRAAPPSALRNLVAARMHQTLAVALSA
ncbi:hypothetical protein AAGS40_04240 [Paraburkholderia sp. PREW-6R]|uniref:hypothetical protein n=1 Tax=Paraburkholderia sp. PREW-6R TaxID=3141544 RepID=UPI0031F49424